MLALCAIHYNLDLCQLLVLMASAGCDEKVAGTRRNSGICMENFWLSVLERVLSSENGRPERCAQTSFDSMKDSV